MLNYMAKNGLMFTLDEENDGPVTLTRWGTCPVNKTTIGSRLDFILIAGALESRTSRSIVCPSNVSDHMIVKVTICTSKRPKLNWSIAPNTLRDPEWVKEMSLELKTLMGDMDKQTILHPPTRWSKIKELIRSYSQAYEKRKRLRWEGNRNKARTRDQSPSKNQTEIGRCKTELVGSFSESNHPAPYMAD
ncbi:hypothetical protein DSO57_1009976 [Entomophthora muscae]|uniref:Uncharacterized protein n=1 Tax=Entomophthora muscae TaxID=34485 RepID=A0ACC2USG1_9FUNG|nr:hypothetical protein DSO57_1009976 [Entomophthora muscae]